MNINSCFSVYHSKYHRIKFGFHVRLRSRVLTPALFHVGRLSIHGRWEVQLGLGFCWTESALQDGNIGKFMGDIGNCRIFVEET